MTRAQAQENNLLLERRERSRYDVSTKAIQRSMLAEHLYAGFTTSRDRRSREKMRECWFFSLSDGANFSVTTSLCSLNHDI
jgi:hypothetical protein